MCCWRRVASAYFSNARRSRRNRPPPRGQHTRRARSTPERRASYRSYSVTGPTCAVLLGCHPPLRGLKPYHARIRLYDGQLLAIGRDEYIEGWPYGGYGIGARTVRVDDITHGGLGLIDHDFAVNAERHYIDPRAVSIEDMIAGAREERLLCDPKCW